MGRGGWVVRALIENVNVSPEFVPSKSDSLLVRVAPMYPNRRADPSKLNSLGFSSFLALLSRWTFLVEWIIRSIVATFVLRSWAF